LVMLLWISRVIDCIASSSSTSSSPSLSSFSNQGLTLVHFTAQHKHSLWDTLDVFSKKSGLG
jgi:hypothetical protein